MPPKKEIRSATAEAEDQERLAVVKEIFAKPKADRTSEDELRQCFDYIKHFPACNSFVPSVVMEMCKEITLDVVEPDGLIMVQGAIGDTYCIILQGTVSVIINDKVVAHVDQGNGFGEMALMSDSPRSATIRADCECFILSIGREPFNVLMKDKHTAALNKRMEFILSLPLFSDWTKKDIYPYTPYFKLMEIQQDEILTRYNEPVANVWFLMKGRCHYKIPKKENALNVVAAPQPVRKSEGNVVMKRQGTESRGGEGKLASVQPREKRFQSMISSVETEEDGSSIPKVQEKKSVRQQQREEDSGYFSFENADLVGTLISGSVFGHVDLLEDRRSTCTVISATRCELLSISRLDFHAMTDEGDGANVNALEEQASKPQATAKTMDEVDQVVSKLHSLFSANEDNVNMQRQAARVGLATIQDVPDGVLHKYGADVVGISFHRHGLLKIIIDSIQKKCDSDILLGYLQLIAKLCTCAFMRKSMAWEDGIKAVVRVMLQGQAGSSTGGPACHGKSHVHMVSTVTATDRADNTWSAMRKLTTMMHGTKDAKWREEQDEKEENRLSRSLEILANCGKSHKCRTLIRSSGAFEFMVSVVRAEGKILAERAALEVSNTANRTSPPSPRNGKLATGSKSGTTFLTAMQDTKHAGGMTALQAGSNVDRTIEESAELWKIDHHTPFLRGKFAVDMVQHALQCISLMAETNHTVHTMLFQEGLLPVLVSILSSSKSYQVRLVVLQLLARCAQTHKCRVDLAKTNLVEQVLSIMRESDSEADGGEMKVRCAEALHRLGSEKTVLDQVQQHNGMGVLLNLMSITGSGETRLMQFACEALSTCAVNPASTVSLHEVGALDSLLNLLDVRDEATVPTQTKVFVLITLKNMFSNSRACRDAFLAKGYGLKTLLRQLKDSIAPRILSEASRALSELGRYEISAKQSMLKEGAMQLCWSLLRNDDMMVVQNGAEALSVCINCPDGRNLVYERHLPTDEICNILRSDKVTSGVKAFGCAVVAAMVQHERLGVVLTEQAVMPALSTLLQSGDPLVQQHCCLAIANLCASKYVQEPVVRRSRCIGRQSMANDDDEVDDDDDDDGNDGNDGNAKDDGSAPNVGVSNQRHFFELMFGESPAFHMADTQAFKRTNNPEPSIRRRRSSIIGENINQRGRRASAVMDGPDKVELEPSHHSSASQTVEILSASSIKWKNEIYDVVWLPGCRRPPNGAKLLVEHAVQEVGSPVEMSTGSVFLNPATAGTKHAEGVWHQMLDHEDYEVRRNLLKMIRVVSEYEPAALALRGLNVVQSLLGLVANCDHGIQESAAQTLHNIINASRSKQQADSETLQQQIMTDRTIRIHSLPQL